RTDQAAFDAADLDFGRNESRRRAPREIDAGLCGDEQRHGDHDQPQQDPDRDKGTVREALHRSAPTLTCSRKSVSGSSRGCAMSTPITPTGERQRAPRPTPFDSDVHGSSPAWPASMNSAAP